MTKNRKKDDITMIKVIGTALNKRIFPYIIFAKLTWTISGWTLILFLTFTSIMDCEISIPSKD